MGGKVAAARWGLGAPSLGTGDAAGAPGVVLGASAVACWDWVTPSLVMRAASATPVMFWAISLVPVETSLTLRFISAVVVVCSSTAEAIVVWKSLICAMTREMSSMAAIAPVVSAW